jgi:hypothetical protein
MTSQVLCFKPIKDQQDDEISFEGRLSCSVRLWLAGRRTKSSKYAEAQKRHSGVRKTHFAVPLQFRRKSVSCLARKVERRIRRKYGTNRHCLEMGHTRRIGRTQIRVCTDHLQFYPPTRSTIHPSALYAYSFGFAETELLYEEFDCWFYSIHTKEGA